MLIKIFNFENSEKNQKIIELKKNSLKNKGYEKDIWCIYWISNYLYMLPDNVDILNILYNVYTYKWYMECYSYSHISYNICWISTDLS